MRYLRSIARIGLAVGLVALAGGLLLAGGSALLAGDWWLAREPWIGWGLLLLVGGLASSAIFALLLDAIEPLGWLRFLALPPALVVVFMWFVWLVFGVPTTGPGAGPERDIRTILYSQPALLVVILVATLLVSLPLAMARIRGARCSVPADAGAAH
jgi:hypothetical protein